MQWSKSKYVFPNLLTLFNLLCGFYSIHIAVTANTPHQISLAGWLIGFAMLCDLFDGRVARATGGQSDFGVQFDSFADAISFGMAPAILLYGWGLQPLGTIGVLLAFAYTACAITRLARFAVESQKNDDRDDEASKYFKGLPTPLAAGTAVSIAMAHVAITDQSHTEAYWNVAGLVIILSSLMVSHIRYRTFKDVKFEGWTLIGVVGLVGLIAVIAYAIGPVIAIMLGMMVYVTVGLGAGLLQLGRNLFFEQSEIDDNHYVVGSLEDKSGPG